MSTDIATEALVQRGKTPLYYDLVSLYQDSQKALYELKNASPAQYNLKLKEMDYPQRFKSIVMKHLGITIGKVELIEAKDANAFATLEFAKNTYRKLEASKLSLAGVMDAIRSVYDDRTAKVDVTQFSSHEFSFIFGIHMGFWRMRRRDQSYFFTPEELTAVTIHEIGHYVHWIQTIFRPNQILLDASDLVDYLGGNPDYKIITLILEKLSKSKTLDKSWKTVLSTTLDYFRTVNDTTSGKYREALGALELLIAADISGYTLEVSNIIMIYGLQSSTQVNSQLHEIDAERNADDFSARNGAYADLTSAVNKIYSLGDRNSLLLVNQYMWVFPAVIFSTLYKFSSIFNIQAEDVSNGYDPLLRRLELIIQTAKHAFSDPHLPKDAMVDIKHQIIEAEKILKAYQQSPYRSVRIKLKAWKESISKYGRIIASPFDNRLSKDYTKLQDSTRDLSRHSLYYLANK